MVKNQGTKQRVQRILGDCWQWETNGQCVKGDNCSFRHDMDKRGKSSPSNPSQNFFMRQSERKPYRGPEVPEVRVRVVECRDGLARITSEEVAITHPAKGGILLNACSTKTKVFVGLGKSGHTHIVRLTHSRRNGPNRIMTRTPWL